MTKQATVRIPADTRAPDWAWQKSQAMHAALCAAADRAIGSERDRLLADIERLEAQISLLSQRYLKKLKHMQSVSDRIRRKAA